MKRNKFVLLLTSVALTLGIGIYAGVKGSESKEAVVTFATYTNGDAATYYNTIDSTKSGNDLLKDLRTLNLSKRKSTVGYSSMGTTPSGQFKYTDYDTNNVEYDSNGQPYGAKISSFYTYTSATSWNREHVWPNSHGGGSNGDVSSPYIDADIHMPRPTISSENSSRGNSFFVEGMNHSSNGWDPYTAGYSAESRGEAARITFYCMTADSRLCLAPANTSPSGTDPVTGLSYGSGHTMGNLETLIKWNINYPVTQREKNRNEGAEYLQGNRNAFIDHPEYACKIWGNVNSKIKSMCDEASWDVGPSVSISKSQASITVDDTTTISATASDSSNITWSSSDQTVVTVSPTSSTSGTNVTLTGIGPGIATVTATATINSTVYTATCSVTVSSSGGGGGGDTPIGDSLTINVNDIPSAYSGTSFTVGNYSFGCSNIGNSYSSGNMQFKSGQGYLYNTTPITNISSITVASPSSGSFSGTIYVGSSSHPTSGTSYTITGGQTVNISGNPSYFTIKANSVSGGAKCGAITIGVTPSQQEKTLSSISVSTAPTKTTYTAGEYFNPTGLVITRTYSDSSSDTYTYSGHTSEFSFNPSTSTALTTSHKSVTITYGGKSCNQAITVNAPITLSSIAVTGAKTSYYVGDTFEKPTVTATYSNNSQANVTNSATFTGYNLSNAGNQTVTVSYTEGGTTKTTTYGITVTAVSLSSISVSNAKTSYYVGDEFELPTVTATYNNGSQQIVDSELTFSGYNLSNPGNQTVTVSYTEGGVTRTTTYGITVNKVELSSIEVTTDITNKTQYVGDSFSSAGLVVTATYNNGDTANVTSYCNITTPNMSTAGIKTVNISYTEDGITKTTSTQITVVEKSASTSSYVKVTSQDDITAGDYLIVYETGSVAFNGALSPLDAVGNKISVTITNNEIEANATTNASKFTIVSMQGGYAIRSASGIYIGRNSNSNGMNVDSTNPLLNTITYSSGNVSITGSGGATLKYNNSSNQNRFRYYQSGQQSIQLYKLTTGSSGGGDTPTLSSISLVDNDVQHYFELGSTFNYDNLKVYAHFEGESSPVEVTSGYIVSTPDMSTVGEQTVTVTYQGKEASYTIEVYAEYSLTSGSPYMNGAKYWMYFAKELDNEIHNYYFTGETEKTYYGKVSEDTSEAVAIFFEEATGGQNIYMIKNNVKYYLYMLVSGNFVNIKFDATSAPDTPWVYDTTRKTMAYGDYVTGADLTHTNFTGTSVVYYAEFITANNEGAEPFAAIFNDLIQCDSTGVKSPTFKNGFTWSDFSAVYQYLDGNSKIELRSSNPSNEEVADFVARYDYIVGKYGNTDFLGRNPTPISNDLNNLLGDDFSSDKSLMIIIIISFASMTSLLVLLVIKKKRHR